MSDSAPAETTDNDSEIERIKRRIEQLAGAHFAKGEQSYFLSQLGNELGNDRKLLEKLTGLKLTQFVRNNFTYEIGARGVHQNAFFLIAPEGTASATASNTTPRYAPRFWAAFAVPLAEGENRSIDLDSFNFGPTEKIELEGVNARPIAPEFIAPQGASGSAAETAHRIAAWLANEALDGTRFHASAKRQRSDCRSLLDQLFTSLDHDQLRRVSLPLDIIKVLSERKS